MTIVITTDEDLRRIIREETRELREALAALQAPKPERTGEPLLTVGEVATRCTVTATTVRAWIHSGALVAQRARRRYLVRLIDLEAFLARANQPAEINSEQHLSILTKRLNEARSK